MRLTKEVYDAIRVKARKRDADGADINDRWIGWRDWIDQKFSGDLTARQLDLLVDFAMKYNERAKNISTEVNLARHSPIPDHQ